MLHLTFQQNAHVSSHNITVEYIVTLLIPVQSRSSDNRFSFSALTKDFTVSKSPLRAAYSSVLSVELAAIFVSDTADNITTTHSILYC